jgi:hypothetical protein
MGQAEFNGAAGKPVSRSWSVGGIEISNSKSQITNKSQSPKFKIPKLFND